MIRWTPTARQELETHLDELRPSLAGSGADPDEVLDDLRRHVAEEATAARLPVVTEADVQRLLAQVTPPAPFPVPIALRRIQPEATRVRTRERDSQGRRMALALCGVVVPLLALIIEEWTRICTDQVMDPLATRWHVALVALVPLANALGLVGRLDSRWEWLLNGAAAGVGTAYVLAFLPVIPLAVVATAYGIGFLALAPAGALICTLLRRHRIARSWPGPRPHAAGAWWAAWGTTLLMLGIFLMHSATTRYFAQVAHGQDTVNAASAIRWLRAWGDPQVILRDCYGCRRRLFWDSILPSALPEEPARQVFFRVTGKPFNSVKPPDSARSRRNRAFFEEFQTIASDKDAGLGGEIVAGQVRGLSLVASRLDAKCDPDAAWQYAEWTLEFRNDHEGVPREARAQIQLPEGGVVSRLTLWVNGEEREAAFSGRSEVREAYKSAAMKERRDPALVTTCGPDRVAIQCFPVPAGGGTLRVRIGITAPLKLLAADEAALTWPAIIERNFEIGHALRHSVWLESPDGPASPTPGLTAAVGEAGRAGWYGQWKDATLLDPHSGVLFRRDPAETLAWAPDRRSEHGGSVRQEVVESRMITPPRLAVVLDTSIGMETVFGEIAAAIGQAPGSSELAVFAARDGVLELADGSRPPSLRDVEEAVRSLAAEGGQDNVPALLKAWEWSSRARESSILWIHGPQPVVLDSAGTLRQRMEWRPGSSEPRLWDFQVQAGPNRVIEKLDGLDAVGRVPRLGSVRDDLLRCFANWSGAAPVFTLIRERIRDPLSAPSVPVATSNPPGEGAQARVPNGGQANLRDSSPGPASKRASSHVTRLWALAEARRLWRERQTADSVALGALYQLVTPATGAVVLDNSQQYVRAGVKAVDPATVPIVPEPGVARLLLVGLGLWAFGSRRRWRR